MSTDLVLRTQPKKTNKVVRKTKAKNVEKALTTKGLEAMVKKLMEKNAEAKVADYYFSNKELYPTPSASFANQILILTGDSTSNSTYQIQQNSYQGGRIGNKVTTKKCVLKGSVCINSSWDATTNDNPQPLFVTMWIVKLKPHLTDEVSTLDTVVNNSFFQSGSNSVGFAGTMVDMCKTVNAQHITLLKKRVFQLGMAQYMSGTGVSSGNNRNQQYANNDSSQTKLFNMDITKLIPKTQSFNDGTNNSVDRRVYLFFSMCRVDGGAITTSLGAVTGPIPVYGNIGVEYQYTDM